MKAEPSEHFATTVFGDGQSATVEILNYPIFALRRRSATPRRLRRQYAAAAHSNPRRHRQDSGVASE
jgi:hypothetical protein